jgi:fructose-1,6-bisphosphatase II
LRRPVSDLTVFVLDKPRHKELIAEIRRAGARVSLQTDGDVMGALMAAIPGTGIDVLMGIGGTPEGVISAAAVKALGGGMQGKRAPQKDYEFEALNALPDDDIGRVLGLDDLIQSNDAFFAATGITDGPFLEGVHFDRNGGVTTHSIVIRALSGSIRYIRGVHQLKPEHVFGDVDIAQAVKMAVY